MAICANQVSPKLVCMIILLSGGTAGPCGGKYGGGRVFSYIFRPLHVECSIALYLCAFHKSLFVERNI